MICQSTLLILLLTFTSSLPSPNPKGRQNKERSNGSCSREKCAEGRNKLKISSECVRAPFCVRQVMRELKKVSKEKSILVKSSKREIDDITAVKAEYGKLMEVHSNMETKLASIAVDKQSLEEKFKRLYDEHENMKTSEALLKTTKAGMKVANGMLETKTKELAAKNNEFKRKIESMEGQTMIADKIAKEKTSLKSSLNEVNRKLKIQEDKNNEIVKSLEVIENQNALNTQNLSNVMKENLELKSAMEVLKTQKANLKEKVSAMTKKESKSKIAQDQISSNLTQCKTDLSGLQKVNSNCKAKIGELNICKSEISKLAKIVEDRLSQVKSKNDDIVTFREKNDILEENLKEAKEELELFNSSLDKKARVLQELETRLEQCEAAHEERRNRQSDDDEDITVKCESPCTISKLASNDLISMDRDSQTEEQTEALKLENKILSKKLENVEESLTSCEQKVVPDVSQAASDSILQELLS